MIKCQLCLTLFLYSFGCRGQKDAPLLPAEWDKQQAVFINYSGNSDDAVTTEKVHTVCRDIIRELAVVTKVYVLINEGFKQDSLRQLFQANRIQINNIYFLPVYRFFSMGVPRDYGPMVVKNKNRGNKIIRFGWDYVGADFINPDTTWARRREFIRDRYFEQMKQFLKIEVESSPLVLEGGEIEVNGKGTAMLVDSFHIPRNPHLSKKQQEDLMAGSLGVKKTIWLREGPAEDPGVGRKSKIIDNVYGNGVGGHVDEFARFVNLNTIFLAMPSKVEAQVDPIKKIIYDRMKINEDILKKSVDQDGKPFAIVHIPVPDVIPETHRVDTTNFQFPISALRHDFPEWKHGDSIQFMPALVILIS